MNRFVAKRLLLAAAVLSVPAALYGHYDDYFFTTNLYGRIGSLSDNTASGTLAVGTNNLFASNTPYSAAVGEGLRAHSSRSLTVGKFNVANSSALFIVGNGSTSADANRRNAFEVLDNGILPHQKGIVNINGETNFNSTVNVSTAGGLTVAGQPVITRGAASVIAASGNTGSTGSTGVLALGWNARAMGASSVSLGHNNLAQGYRSIAAGHGNEAYGDESFASGYATKAYGWVSFAGGRESIAGVPPGRTWGDETGAYSFAFGKQITATGMGSTAFGLNNGASGDGSFAAGGWSAASGPYSVTLGQDNIAFEAFSVAIGMSNRAHSQTSLALGYGLKTWMQGQTVVGRFNNYGGFTGPGTTPVLDTTLDGNDEVFVVGGGSADQSRWNVFTVKANGDAGVGGSFSIKSATINADSSGSAVFVKPIILEGAAVAGDIPMYSEN